MAKHTVNVTVETDAQGGAKIGVNPWVVNIEKNDKIEWVYTGAPELYEIEVTLKEDDSGLVAGIERPVGGYNPADVKKNEFKKNKLDFTFNHHSTGNNNDPPDIGRYAVMLILIGLGAVILDPGYRVSP